MLDPLIVTLEIIDNKLVARSEEATLCNQYDRNPRVIEVVRPEQFAEDDLVLTFRDAFATYDPANLGTGNAYLVPGLVTRTLRLEMQAAIHRNGIEIAHSTILKLSLNPTIPENPPPVNEVLDLYNTVHTELMHSVEREGNVVRLLSLLGETLGTINVAGGGGDGSGNPVKIGTVTTETLDPDEGARVDASIRYEADADYLDLVFYLPRGRDGADGADGVSIQGPTGEDGYTPVKDVDYFDGQDGAPGADGKAATIRIGEVTTGSVASVTNVGTDTDAVLDFVLQRGEPGAGGGDDLPWVSGYFQDRSLAVKIYTTITPEYAQGEASLIVGNRFVAPIDGIYLLAVGIKVVSATGNQAQYIYKNTEASGTTAITGPVIAFSYVPAAMITPSVCTVQYLNAGEYLSTVMMSTVAQSTIKAPYSLNDFLFARIK